MVPPGLNPESQARSKGVAGQSGDDGPERGPHCPTKKAAREDRRQRLKRNQRDKGRRESGVPTLSPPGCGSGTDVP